MRTVIDHYLKYLEAGDAEKITALFASNGIVHSPIYGERPAGEFFRALFADTSESKLTVLNIFTNDDNPLTHAIHFRYEWKLKNNEQASFECVDVFKFDKQGKITDMTIIYDTFKTRQAYKTLQQDT